MRFKLGIKFKLFNILKYLTNNVNLVKMRPNRGFSSNIEDNWNKKFSKRFVEVRKRNVFVIINHFHICSALPRWAGDKEKVWSPVDTLTATLTTSIKENFSEKFSKSNFIWPSISSYLHNLHHAAEREGESDEDDEEGDQGQQVRAYAGSLLTDRLWQHGNLQCPAWQCLVWQCPIVSVAMSSMAMSNVECVAMSNAQCGNVEHGNVQHGNVQ